MEFTGTITSYKYIGNEGSKLALLAYHKHFQMKAVRF